MTPWPSTLPETCACCRSWPAIFWRWPPAATCDSSIRSSTSTPTRNRLGRSQDHRADRQGVIVSPPISRRLYVQRVLDLYRLAPGTTGQLRRCDRQLASALPRPRRVAPDRPRRADPCRRATNLSLPGRIPLAPIATLQYFRPVIDELLAQPRTNATSPHSIQARRRAPNFVAPATMIT